MVELLGSIATAEAASFSHMISTAVNSEFSPIWWARTPVCPIGLRHLYMVGILGLRRFSLTIWFRPVVGLVGFLLDMR